MVGGVAREAALPLPPIAVTTAATGARCSIVWYGRHTLGVTYGTWGFQTDGLSSCDNYIMSPWEALTCPSERKIACVVMNDMAVYFYCGICANESMNGPFTFTLVADHNKSCYQVQAPVMHEKPRLRPWEPHSRRCSGWHSLRFSVSVLASRLANL